MPKTFVKDGSTVREATKVFVKDGSTVREATKIFVNQGGTIRQVYAKVIVPFQIYLRGTWTLTEGGSSGVGFSATFASEGTTTGTFDPQAGDILLFSQSQTRANSSVATTQFGTGYTGIDGRAGVTFQTTSGSGKSETTTTHRPAYLISYKVLTGSDTGYSGAAGFNSGGEGNSHQFHLLRPQTPISSSNVTLVETTSTAITSSGALANQSIPSNSSDAVIQWAFGASGSGSTAAQTLTTSSGSMTSTGSTGRTSNSLVTLANKTTNAAVGIDRGNSNYLFSGQFRVTEP